MKPDPNVNHPDDDKDLHEAEQTIGDYKLKVDPGYDAPEDVRSTTLKKIQELLTVREEVGQKELSSVNKNQNRFSVGF